MTKFNVGDVVGIKAENSPSDRERIMRGFNARMVASVESGYVGFAGDSWPSWDSSRFNLVEAVNVAQEETNEVPADVANPFPAKVRAILSEIGDTLIAKNQQYGNSALEPVRIFSKASAVEQIKVRMDDKISRLVRGNGEGDEDAQADLLGYLVLLRIAEQSSDEEN